MGRSRRAARAYHLAPATASDMVAASDAVAVSAGRRRAQAVLAGGDHAASDKGPLAAAASDKGLLAAAASDKGLLAAAASDKGLLAAAASDKGLLAAAAAASGLAEVAGAGMTHSRSDLACADQNERSILGYEGVYTRDSKKCRKLSAETLSVDS